MVQRPLPSLGPVLAEARSEREAQLRHADSLDSKAGILLGFAGALVALTPQQAHLLVDLGRVAAVLAAILALSAFWPRRFPITNLDVLRDRYLTAEPVFTQRRILDTHIAMVEVTRVVFERKVRRLELGMGSLVAAAILVAGGLILT